MCCSKLSHSNSFAMNSGRTCLSWAHEGNCGMALEDYRHLSAPSLKSELPASSESGPESSQVREVENATKHS